MAVRNFFLFLTLEFLSSTIAMELSKIPPAEGPVTNETIKEVDLSSPEVMALLDTAKSWISTDNLTSGSSQTFTPIRARQIIEEDFVVDSLTLLVNRTRCKNFGSSPNETDCRVWQIEESYECLVRKSTRASTNFAVVFCENDAGPDLVEYVPVDSPTMISLRTMALAELDQRPSESPSPRMYEAVRGIHKIFRNETLDSLTFRLYDVRCIDYTNIRNKTRCAAMNIIKRYTCFIERLGTQLSEDTTDLFCDTEDLVRVLDLGSPEMIKLINMAPFKFYQSILFTPTVPTNCMVSVDTPSANDCDDKWDKDYICLLEEHITGRLNLKNFTISCEEYVPS